MKTKGKLEQKTTKLEISIQNFFLDLIFRNNEFLFVSMEQDKFFRRTSGQTTFPKL